MQPDPTSPLDLEAIRQRHEDFTVLWAGPVEAMTTPLTAAGAVTCAAAASADDVSALLAALAEARRDAENAIFELAALRQAVERVTGSDEDHVDALQDLGAALAAARADAERIRELIDSYPPGSVFVQSGAQALFRRVLAGGTE
jgi:hypothetical protein